jgi:hypothetical protein
MKSFITEVLLPAIGCTIVVLTILSISSCEKQLTAPVPTMDRSGIPVLITIHYVPTKIALDRAFEDQGGEAGGLGNLRAFSQYNAIPRPPDAAYNWCDVWVIRPQGIDDDNVMALGHEVQHCTDGEYHR